MDTISKARKIISLVLKLIVIISAVLGIVMSAAAGRNVPQKNRPLGLT